MGMSLDAKIMYGMVIHDGEETVVDVPWLDDEDSDFESWATKQLGLEPLDYSTYPEERYDPKREAYDAYHRRMTEKRDEWRIQMGATAYYARARELIETIPIEEDFGGTDDFHSTILRFKNSPKLNAYYGPTPFDPMTLMVPDDSPAMAFLEPFGVKWVGEWLLVPSYG